MKVLILHDHVPALARADEADALVQAQAVSRALEVLGHEWMTLGLTLDLHAARIALQELAPDVVFNLCESLGGLARLIHVPCDLLDALRIPYTGAPAAAMMLTSNKLTAKHMLRLANLPTAAWHTCSFPAAEPGTHGFEPGRYIIKSVWEHASIGLGDDSIVNIRHIDELTKAIVDRADRPGGEAFAESYIEGREFNLALLANQSEPEILPPCEIVFENFPRERAKIVNYSAKWDENSFEYAHTPRRYDVQPSDAPLLERMKSLALQCWRLFDLHGYARVDFRVDEAGNPLILEVNTNPCLSPDAGFAAALEQAGISFTDAVQRILGHVPQAPAAASSKSQGQTKRESQPRQTADIPTKAR